MESLSSIGIPAVVEHVKRGCTLVYKAPIKLRSVRLKWKPSPDFSFFLTLGSFEVFMNIPRSVLCHGTFVRLRRCFVTWRKVERFDEDAGVSCLHIWALHWGLRPAGFSYQNTGFPTVALNQRHRPVHIALFVKAICFRNPEKAEIRRISEAEVYMDRNHSGLKLSQKHLFGLGETNPCQTPIPTSYF